MATALIEQFTGTFEPEKYEDTYREALLDDRSRRSRRARRSRRRRSRRTRSPPTCWRR